MPSACLSSPLSRPPDPGASARGPSEPSRFEAGPPPAPWSLEVVLRELAVEHLERGVLAVDGGGNLGTAAGLAKEALQAFGGAGHAPVAHGELHFGDAGLEVLVEAERSAGSGLHRRLGKSQDLSLSRPVPWLPHRAWRQSRRGRPEGRRWCPP